MILPGKIRLRYLGAMILFVLFIAPQAMGTPGTSRITDIAIRSSDNEVELNVIGAIEYGYFPLSEPERLVFDFPGATLDLEDTAISRAVSGAVFREVQLTQFSEDPPIARLVFYLTEPGTAVVSFDLNEGVLLIRVNSDCGTEGPPTVETTPMRDLFAQPEIPETVVQTTEATVRPPTEDLTDNYILTESAEELTIGFPFLTTDNISVSQVRFPDRVVIRLLTNGSIGAERPRFDQLDRGNIWNDVAKTWASYIDRDGRGVIDLTIYTYPNVGYSQMIDRGGIPVVRLFKLTIPEIPESPVSFEVSPEISEVEVSAFTSEEEPAEVTEPVITEETTIEEVAEEEDVPVNSEDTEPAEVAEQNEEISISSLPVTESVEIIENAVLITGSETTEEDEADTESDMIAEAAMTPPNVGLPVLPIALGQGNLLGNGNGDRGPEAIYMRVGDVQVINVMNLVRASVGNPEVAILNVISQDELLVTALKPGSTSLLTWESGLGYVTREVNVLDATQLREEEIASVIDDGDIRVRILMSGESAPTPGVILEGRVETEEERARAQLIASLYAGERVTNLIEVTDPRQVLAQVRVVEINRRAMDEHLSQFSAAARADNDAFTVGIITDLLDPENPGGGLIDSRTRPGIVNNGVDDMVFDPIDIVLNELVTNREATILSQPNVLAMSGHSAQFRVGGEVPYTYLNENGVTVVEFKEFGISLNMTPFVDSHGNIMLTLNPVVRTIDYALAISGIPGFRTREMTTEVQLRSGETLVIGGLIQNEITEVISEIPILSQIPILGELFRSKRFTEDETELVIFITPHIISSSEMSGEICGIDPLKE